MEGSSIVLLYIEGKKELARDEVRQNSREKSKIEKCLKAYSGLQERWHGKEEMK